MAGEQDQRIDLGVRGASSGARPDDPEPDAIELGSSGLAWLRSWRFRVAGLICAALIVGVLAGYVVASPGARTASGPNGAGPNGAGPNGAVPTTRLLVAGPGQPPTVTGSRCSAQVGNALQLGLEVVNPSTMGTTLLGIEVELPLNGLRLTGTAWGGCGQMVVTNGADPYPLPPGATTWLTMTFDVAISCPAPLPVQVTLRYAQADRAATTPLGGFSDLGDVPYSGCTESPG